MQKKNFLKGQGALETLLLIGGAILIAITVIATITSIGNNAGGSISSGAECASIIGCSTCKQNPACSGFSANGIPLFSGATGAPDCTTTEAQSFTQCKPGGSGGSLPPTCGDGDIDPGEQCGEPGLPASNCTAQTGGLLPQGSGSCSPTNCTFDASQCYNCGNGTIEGAEVCDGLNLDEKICTMLGFSGGTPLICSPNCLTFDTTNCTGGGTENLTAPGSCCNSIGATGLDDDSDTFFDGQDGGCYIDPNPIAGNTTTTTCWNYYQNNNSGQIHYSPVYTCPTGQKITSANYDWLHTCGAPNFKAYNSAWAEIPLMSGTNQTLTAAQVNGNKIIFWANDCTGPTYQGLIGKVNNITCGPGGTEDKMTIGSCCNSTDDDSDNSFDGADMGCNASRDLSMDPVCWAAYSNNDSTIYSSGQFSCTTAGYKVSSASYTVSAGAQSCLSTGGGYFKAFDEYGTEIPLLTSSGSHSLSGSEIHSSKISFSAKDCPGFTGQIANINSIMCGMPPSEMCCDNSDNDWDAYVDAEDNTVTSNCSSQSQTNISGTVSPCWQSKNPYNVWRNDSSGLFSCSSGNLISSVSYEIQTDRRPGCSPCTGTDSLFFLYPTSGTMSFISSCKPYGTISQDNGSSDVGGCTSFRTATGFTAQTGLRFGYTTDGSDSYSGNYFKISSITCNTPSNEDQNTFGSCCDIMDNDYDGYVDAEDQWSGRCSRDITLGNGNGENSVCWKTRQPYFNSQSITSGYFSCPMGKEVKTVSYSINTESGHDFFYIDRADGSQATSNSGSASTTYNMPGSQQRTRFRFISDAATVPTNGYATVSSVRCG